MRDRLYILLASLFLLLYSWHAARGQAGSIDGATLADLSLKTIASVPPADRRGARSLSARQIGALPEEQRIAAATKLLERLRETDAKAREADIISVLANMPIPWASKDTAQDSRYIYDLYQKETEETLKASLDAALANARGLYKDGIADYSSTTPSEFVRAPNKLKYMADTFPKSKYAENASFYLGQYYTRAYFLLDTPGKATFIKTSNSAFEDYIEKTESNKFPTKNYLPAAYFYRGLNGWINNDLKDARNWLTRGSEKFTDKDTIYIYRILPTTDNSQVLDDYFVARSTFNKTLAFLNGSPPPSYLQVNALIPKLKQK